MEQRGEAWLLAIVALAILACAPLADVYWFDSHEHVEYVSRTVEYAEALARGDLYPRWCADFYGGYGSPFFNFYAPLVYALGGLLTHVVGSPVLGLKLVVLFGSVVAGAATFGLIHLETRRPDAAFVGACLYLAVPYRLADVAWRGDLSEFTALGLLPLALFAYRRIVHQSNPDRLPWTVAFAALAHAALVLCHTLLGLWGTGIVAVVALLSAVELVRRHARERALMLGVAFAGALSVSAPYTLPAMIERRFVRTETMTLGWSDPANNWLSPKELWEPGPFYLGPFVLAAACLMMIAALRRRRFAFGALPWLAGALMFVGLTLPQAVPLWTSRLIPFGKYIQFPWRLLGPAGLCAAVSVGLLWANLVAPRFLAKLLAVPVAAFAFMVARPQTELQSVNPVDLMLSGARIRDARISGTALDEYLPRVVAAVPGAAASRVAQSTESVTVDVEKSSGTTHVLKLSARRPTSLELNLHAFPGWRATTHGSGRRVTLSTTARGLVGLEVPEAGDYRVSVTFGTTPSRGIGFLLCLLGLLMTLPTARFLARSAALQHRRPVEPGHDLEGAIA